MKVSYQKLELQQLRKSHPKDGPAIIQLRVFARFYD
jgi:hypothetical protein